MDYLALYNLENYLFDTVRQRFQTAGFLTAYDFFCIIIWKANRAKSNIARKLLKKGYQTLDAAVYDLSTGLMGQTTPRERMRYLWDGSSWGFYLPMASAILTVLYPDDFTVYDVRVCEALDDFQSLINITVFEKLWPCYQAFKVAVEQATPDSLSLRDKDRYLWSKSFHGQLVNDIEQGFKTVASEE